MHPKITSTEDILRAKRLEELGLDVPRIRRGLGKHGKLPAIDAMDKSVPYLLDEIGLTHAQISSSSWLIGRRKEVLSSIAAFVRASGLSSDVFVKHPPLIGYSIPNKIIPVLDAILDEFNLDLSVLEREPKIFRSSVRRLRTVFRYVTRALHIYDGVFVNYPTLFGYSPRYNIRPTYQYIVRDLGLPKEVFEMQPALFGYSLEDNIKPTVEFVRDEMELSVETFATRPALIGNSLEGRIKPRVAFMRLQGMEVFTGDMISISDAKFCARVGVEAEQYYAFRDDFLRKAV